VGQPLVAPSANLSGKPSSTTAQHVAADFEGKIKAVIDGGPTEYGIESTVVSLVSADPCLLRLGAVPKAEIEKVLNMPLGEATYQNMLSSPGTRYRHYAPEARIKLFIDQAKFTDYLEVKTSLRRWVNPQVTTTNLYAMLRQADDEKYEEIVIFCSDEMQQNSVLIDRLLRVAAED
ncbi:MAG TPA: Sua5/YciO/YrdC/YwlC family protein, partial [Rhabdochlamydiaceae bacterium]|nr:Sua5/YciO/YrdC/YwlC family protein [Rhabdochlamydiaceae bacterium]